MNYLKTSGACCDPCKTPQIVNVPGTKGDKGDGGLNGFDGANAYTLLDDDFVMPAVNGTVTVTVLSTAFMAVGLPVFVETAGSMRVDSVIDGTTAVLENLGYLGNASPATNIIAGAKVTAMGEKGLDSAGSERTGSFNLPNGVQSFAITGQAFGFIPSIVVVTLHKPAGGLNIAALVLDGSVTNDGFEVWLTGITDSTDYIIHYIAYP